MLPGKLDDLVILDQETRLARHLVSLIFDLAQLGDVETENIACLRLVQRWIVQGHVDTGLEGLIDGAHAVSRQEKQAYSSLDIALVI